jgi:hypothetical protein
MEIKIIAIAPNDGWAFIVKEGKIFLLRPPYTSSNQIEVSRRVVENAIHLHGFEECDITLSSVNEVVRFLKEAYIELKKKQGVSLPSSEQLRELLKYATDDVLLEYLTKAKRELIPEGELDAAESIALELMKLEKVKKNPEMGELGLDILEKCNQERKRMKELAIGMSNNLKDTWAIRFPDAVGRYPIDSIIKRQKVISARGHLLPMESGCV